MSLSNIVERTGSTQENAINCITVLLKHNLLRAEFNSYKHAHYYTFNFSECLLRMSLPRYLGTSVAKSTTTTTGLKS